MGFPDPPPPMGFLDEPDPDPDEPELPPIPGFFPFLWDRERSMEPLLDDPGWFWPEEELEDLWWESDEFESCESLWPLLWPCSWSLRASRSESDSPLASRDGSGLNAGTVLTIFLFCKEN